MLTGQMTTTDSPHVSIRFSSTDGRLIAAGTGHWVDMCDGALSLESPPALDRCHAAEDAPAGVLIVLARSSD